MRTTAIHWSISLLMLTAVASLATADNVYRAVDNDGQPIYSDRPLEGYQETFELDVRHSSPDAIRQQRTASATASASADTMEAQDEQAANSAAAANAATAAQIAENCVAAKERAEKYSSNSRLFRETAEGEREYLTSEEIDAVRAEAVSTVAEWCD